MCSWLCMCFRRSRVLEHFKSDLGVDTCMDVQLLGDFTNFLPVSIVTIASTLCLERQRHTSKNFALILPNSKLTLTAMPTHSTSPISTDPQLAGIPFVQLVESLRWIARHTHPEAVQPFEYLAVLATEYLYRSKRSSLKIILKGPAHVLSDPTLELPMSFEGVESRCVLRGDTCHIGHCDFWLRTC